MQCASELISVIVPVYNTELYLDRCITSIINQTYGNLEIILVDDGSTDRSSLICDTYEKTDKRIKVIHKQNGGLSSARNRGMEIAKGKYIGFVDSDDYIADDMYELLVRCLVNDDDIDIVTCGRWRIFPNDAGYKQKILCAKTKVKYNKERAVEELLKRRLLSYGVCEKLYRKELFEGIRFPEGRISEDIPVTYALFKKCKNVVNIGQAKYYQFLREDSLSRRDFFFRRIDNVIFFRDILKDVKKEYPQFSEIAEANYISSVVARINDIKTSKNRMLYIGLEKRLKKVLRRMCLRIVLNKCMSRSEKETVVRIIAAKG